MKNIRYTQGPDIIDLGDIKFKRGEAQEISDEMAAQALLPQRVAEYGFEEAAPAPVAAPADAPRAAPKKTAALTEDKE